MAKLGQFSFTVPEHLISNKPAIYRDESRLMVVHKDSGEIEHKKFKDIINYFGEGDVTIVNNSKVFPARLHGTKEKTGAKIEVFLLRELNKENLLWDVVVDPARKVRIGNKLIFNNELNGEMLVAEVIDNTTSKGRTIRFYFDGSYEEFQRVLHAMGSTPLPRYMEREPDSDDEESYQTIFAKQKGSIAAPAAGMHFSKEILKWFEIKGVDLTEVTLHIGLASFRGIEVEDLSKHKMESENFYVSPEAAKIVNQGIQNKKRICAIGTSTLRAIESSVSTLSELLPIEGWTEKFIYPQYDFKIANALVTNFHAPKTPFYIATTAFGGLELIKKAYQVAIKENYKFLDYGDVMLII
ncbi:MAG: tRNA preQ1(34) S-adenosylmethionine ribosyltransferase-isomerase QueA [Bacteroidetes bacterium]|jgi:S-adenosylmethionine:tRNA ribosyltransferase-isomerase|nr:tRNA preQ1(34) S-adenosylmethionine ribosyltransferase-isomerase QueA [Bacteroidota bacterium]MBT5528108.1 tRNA preQ1(34) S-adenosylmethionine ribosyltransferase-isomerase QueA [Cytophagia bacterium]MBT3423983.1 tRNA preQ1(34) S-adenosylmethionine ribosyltransferase-isomerase QueA [Bacteroidota bacterium]MBT3801807.1 tRNA preQ1(34) S-adenosylmethionine ribosyltransferase-isomerase QueA [Bacteroidota bacterium]MBT4339149.1 tRNA preQ1(34) S-adenosylmethionine ribosyltransferase-isomerase QueA 